MKEEEIIATLSHSYFNYTLKEVRPFLEYFDENVPLKLTKEMVDSEVLEKLFFLATISTIDMSIPFNFCCKDNVNHSLKKHQWLTDLKPFGSKSKQGVVSKSLLFDKFYVVIKRAKTSRFDEITLRDFCVGINLNKIINESPFFVRTLGCFQYKNQFHIATEFIDGINLKNFLIDKKSAFKDFLNIFFQILLGLEVAQNKLNFSHYDLHTDNVILVHTKDNPIKISLYGYQYTINSPYKPVMIDFGLSSVCTKGQTLGQKSLETKGIFNYLSPGYDIYVFLLFCVDVVQNKNLSIFKGITDLLLFFKSETNLSVDLLTNNHIKSLQKGVSNLIPYKFITFIIQRYHNDLDIEIQPKKFTDDCLGRQPTFLKLKKILDVNDELEHVNNSYKKKGLIRSLLNNIKIYYWYKEKNSLSKSDIDYLLDLDKTNLENILYDLNLKIYKKGSEEPKISIEQKNLFFIALDYYYFILELELHRQYSVYSNFLKSFRETFVYKNIFKQLDTILLEERINRHF